MLIRRAILVIGAFLPLLMTTCVPPADVIVGSGQVEAGGTLRIPIWITRRDLGAAYLRLDYDHAVVAGVPECQACRGDVTVVAGPDFSLDPEGDLGLLAVESAGGVLPINLIDGCVFAIRPDAAPGSFALHVSLAEGLLQGMEEYAPLALSTEDGMLEVSCRSCGGQTSPAASG